MVEIMPESRGKMLAIKATGKLSDSDYKEIWIPKMEELVAQFGRIRVLMYFAKDFAGWELHAAWDDAVFGIKHRNDFERVAVVGASKWIEWGSKLGAHLIGGEVRTFSADGLQEALDWIQS